MSIRDVIAAHRRGRIARDGHNMGVPIPAARTAPLVAFGSEPCLVCEVKRRSPSRGDIAPGLDPVAQASAYAAAGVRSISVLTEQDSFGGSLADLIAIKTALPGIAILRKDFLLDVEDVEVSWRAGADAVLLIASMLDPQPLAALHARALALGMQALVEVHDKADVEKCRTFAPPLAGINARDLATFQVDLLHPLRLLPRFHWPARVIFESGVRSAEDVRLARSAGFDGVLVGEAAVRDPRIVPRLLDAVRGRSGARAAGSVPRAREASGFWPRLCARMRPDRPLVKICGITQRDDAEQAASLGADVLGFVFAASKRRAAPELVRELRGLSVLKVGVVVSEPGPASPRLDPDARALLDEGLLDAVQFHGDERPEECAGLAFPYYKALRVAGLRDIEAMLGWQCPRVLLDAYVPGAPGGTGARIPPELAVAARQRGPLWLAGGLCPDNIRQAVRALAPELVDASSGLESAPGRKDPAKLSRFFEEVGGNGST